jgi:hypothetical protein
LSEPLRNRARTTSANDPRFVHLIAFLDPSQHVNDPPNHLTSVQVPP